MPKGKHQIDGILWSSISAKRKDEEQLARRNEEQLTRLKRKNFWLREKMRILQARMMETMMVHLQRDMETAGRRRKSNNREG